MEQPDRWSAAYWKEQEQEVFQSNYQKVREFHKAFSVPLDCTIDKKNTYLRADLIGEEFFEVNREFFDDFDLDNTSIFRVKETVDVKNLAKELADLLYVVYGTAATFGIDIDRVFDEVHQSNMSKLGKDGKPVYREDGKVLKGPNYQPPRLDWISK